jgi:hypothetical protein
MPTVIEWYVPQRIIYVQISRTLSLEQLKGINTDVISMLDSGTAPVHVFADTRYLESVHRGLRSTTRSVTALRHPKHGWTVYFGKPAPFIRFMINAVSRIMQAKFSIQSTPQDALDFLREQDNTIDWQQANTHLFNDSVNGV